MEPITISANGEAKVKLKPASFLPAANFTFKSSLNIPIKVVVSGTTITLEAG